MINSDKASPLEIIPSVNKKRKNYAAKINQDNVESGIKILDISTWVNMTWKR